VATASTPLSFDHKAATSSTGATPSLKSGAVLEENKAGGKAHGCGGYRSAATCSAAQLSHCRSKMDQFGPILRIAGSEM
jgi:hypothetical protein